jgi:hypothetical protein
VPSSDTAYAFCRVRMSTAQHAADQNGAPAWPTSCVLSSAMPVPLKEMLALAPCSRERERWTDAGKRGTHALRGRVVRRGGRLRVEPQAAVRPHRAAIVDCTVRRRQLCSAGAGGPRTREAEHGHRESRAAKGARPRARTLRGKGSASHREASPPALSTDCSPTARRAMARHEAHIASPLSRSAAPSSVSSD